MKKLLIGIALAAAFAAHAGGMAETVTTPLGLEVRPVGVHKELPESGSDESGHQSRYGDFSHGNLTVRFVVNNPTDVPQPLTVEFPLRIGNFRALFDSGHRVRCLFSRLVPPGADHVIDFAVPHLGSMSVDQSYKEWKFIDGSGKSAPWREWCFDLGSERFEFESDYGWTPDSPATEMPSYSRLFSIALSPSVQRVKDFDDRFTEAVQKLRNHKHTHYDLRTIRPDFNAFHDWRDLACYDAFVVSLADGAKFSDEFQELLKDYQAAGGKVLFAESVGDLDLVRLYEDMVASCRSLRGYGADPASKSDRDAIAKVATHKHAVPFGAIVLVLLVFSIVAGPVTIVWLAKRGRRIELLWVFPAVSVVFSVAVALTIVFANGFSVKVTEFEEREDRPEFGRQVVVRNTVYVAPFPMTDPIRCPAKALVTVDSGDDKSAGDYIVSTPEGLELVGGWTPCLWPVRVRTMEVIRTGKEDAR